MDFNQLLNDPTLCTQLQAVDLDPFVKIIGLALFPVVRWLVEYIKNNWPVIAKLIPAPILANITGILTNLGLASYVGLSPQGAVVVGIVTGLFSMLYHDAKKPSTPTVVNVSK